MKFLIGTALSVVCATSIRAGAQDLASVIGDNAVAGAVVEFHIAYGTRDKPWNDLTTVVEVRVGQTLLLINDDAIPHYLHTPGAPCEHGENPFGGDPSASIEARSYACKIIATADSQTTILYDHNFGRNARFYVHAVE